MQVNPGVTLSTYALRQKLAPQPKSNKFQATKMFGFFQNYQDVVNRIKHHLGKYPRFREGRQDRERTSLDTDWFRHNHRVHLVCLLLQPRLEYRLDFFTSVSSIVVIGRLTSWYSVSLSS